MKVNTCQIFFGLVMPMIITSLLVVVRAAQNETALPVVVWHGLGDTACNPLSMGVIKEILEEHLPAGTFIYLVEVDGNCVEDEFGGWFGQVDAQLAQVAQKLANEPALAGGFNAIGFSQGGQFLRGYVERFNQPPVHNLISIGGQHRGVWGLPKCPGSNLTLCDWARELLDLGAYDWVVQRALVPAQYWVDPLDFSDYVNTSMYLADINNERASKNSEYSDRLRSLSQFVLVRFTEDTVVQPIASEWFGYYRTGDPSVIESMEEWQGYVEDWLGLRTLHQSGRMKFLSVVGDHLQFSEDWFIQSIIQPFLF